MISRSGFTIGCLGLSALMLMVGVLVLASFETQRAEASGMIDVNNKYTLLTGYLNSSAELVYVVAADQLLVYRLNETTRQLELMQGPVPLDDSGTQRGNQRPNLRP